MNHQSHLALIGIGVLLFQYCNSVTKADETSDQSTLVHSEFASISEAVLVEKRVRVVSDKVAPAVVKLPDGSGVVIHPSGLILTHGHHGELKGTQLKVTFPNGTVVDAIIECVFSGRGRDFSLLKIQNPGTYPAVELRLEKPPVAGDRCFHFGYPMQLNANAALSTPVLRLGRIAGSGRTSTYANCLIVSGDSGGPLFDLEGRLIGILDLSIGPELRHPGIWADICRIHDGATFLTDSDDEEVVKLGFTNGKRRAVDTQRQLEDKVCPELLESARRATVEVLIDGQPNILGTIVDPDGIVLTKRSEIMTHSGTLLGALTCRLFDGEVVSANAVADSREEDVALLQLPKRGLTSAHLSEYEEPRRGVIVVVPVPGKDVSETGVLSLDHLLGFEPHCGQLKLGVEMSDEEVMISSAVHDVDGNGFSKLVRGSIHEGDVITHIDGERTSDLAAYQKQATNKSFIGGEFVELSIRRNGIASKAAIPVESEYGITRHIFADVSLRLSGFSAVVIHDTIVGRRQCGGPVVDLEGRIVGVNIARFHRCSTFAIPQQRIPQLVQTLMRNAQR